MVFLRPKMAKTTTQTMAMKMAVTMLLNTLRFTDSVAGK